MLDRQIGIQSVLIKHNKNTVKRVKEFVASITVLLKVHCVPCVVQYRTEQ